MKLAFRGQVPQPASGSGFVIGRQAASLRRNQIACRALLGMDGRKPYETPRWRPGDRDREAMCCSCCGGRDHSYEQCPLFEASDANSDASRNVGVNGSDTGRPA
jgi:hypothetical protein